MYLEQDLHSKLPGPFILTNSEPKVVQAREEHAAGAKELTNTVMGKDSEPIVLTKDDKKGIESILFFLHSG